MLTDLAEGRRDAVIVYHLDRLTRRPVELEHFVQVCQRAGVRDVITLSGDLDLTNGDALLMARVLGALAANQSDSAARRVRRKMQEIAETGRPAMGGVRPFGFAADRTTHDPTEAQVVRDLAARALAGESLTSLTGWLRDAGVASVTGATWRTHTVRQLLTNPRIWGMRVHRGQVIGPGAWEPILTAEQGERLTGLLTDPTRRTTTRTARRYLLNGLLTCSKCGGVLTSSPVRGTRIYGCLKSPDHDGCGRTYIRTEALERHIVAAVLYRLDTPGLTRALSAAPDHDQQATAVAQAVEDDQRLLEDLARDFADHKIERSEWMAAREQIRPRLEDNRRTLARLNHRDAIADYIGHGDELRAAWDTLNLTRQAAIVKAVLASATILPPTSPGRHGLDADRIVPIWRP